MRVMPSRGTLQVPHAPDRRDGADRPAEKRGVTVGQGTAGGPEKKENKEEDVPRDSWVY